MNLETFLEEDKDFTTTPNEIPILFEMVSENNYDSNNVLMQVFNTDMNPIAEGKSIVNV